MAEPRRGFLQDLSVRLKAVLLKKPEAAAQAEPPPEIEAEPCCAGASVHVAFRGISDDRMYLSRDRKWNEVRFFRRHGLRVFCSQCRRRLV